MSGRRTRWALLLIAVAATGCSREPEQQPLAAPPPSQVQSPPVEPQATLAAPEATPAAAAQTESQPPVLPEVRSHILVRRPDTRPRHNDAELAELGIAAYESKRLKLYTDIDPDVARTLPPIIDQAYVAWESYFGPLPPASDGTEYQMTGYIMADADLFRRAGLLPEDLPEFKHGRHRDAEFWMNDQEYDYYRRHLLIHEATHCFMTALRSMRDVPPVWYMEGMAELFGTHSTVRRGSPDPAAPADRRSPASRETSGRPLWSGQETGPKPQETGPQPQIRFRVMPHDRNEFAGLGRITMIRNEIADGRFRSLDRVLKMRANSFLRDEAYAWSWALCYFLDTHPRYRGRFRQLGDCLTFEAFRRTFSELFERDMADLRTEWALFADNLQEGYDVVSAAISFEPGAPLTGGRRSVEIAANRGWQSAGVLVEQGTEYRIEATGEFALAQEPIAWISQPQGISFRYFGGRPLGELHATVRAAESDASERERMLEAVPVGREAAFTAPATGTLYLRLNDSWSELADNTGAVRVTVERPETASP